MKNSAWYQKLWLKKLDKLPVTNSDSDWNEMRALLDKDMPTSGRTVAKPVFSPAAKLVKTIAGYLLPVIILAGFILYYTWPVTKNKSKTDKTNKINITHIAVVNANPPEPNKFTRQNNPVTDSPAASYHANAEDNHYKDKNVAGTSSKDISKAGTGNSSKHTSLLASASNPIKGTGNPAEKNYKNKITRSYRSNYVAVNNVNGKRERRNPKQGGQLHRPLRPGNSSDSAQQTSGLIGSPKNNAINTNKPGTINWANNAHQQQGVAAAIQNNQQPAVGNEAIKDIHPDLGNSQAANNKVMAGQEGSNNTNIKNVAALNPKRNKTANPSKGKTVNKSAKNKKHEIITPRYNYGLETGLNTGAGNSTSIYLGAFGTYAIKPRLLINVALHINSERTISGRFTHATYNGQDSIPPFGVVDTRKLMVADIPVTVEYKLFNSLSIKAGALIILPVKQSGVGTKLEPIAYVRDTLYHTQEINTALNNTTLNRVNLGFTGGISVHIKHFDINGSYQVLKPYRVSDALGSYHKTYQTFQLGVAWRFR